MPSPKPAVIIRREFEATPEVVTQQLRACIIGPACQLVRFANAAEKDNGFVERLYSLSSETISGGATVNSSVAPKNLLLADDTKDFKKIATNSRLDVNSVKVFMEDATLTYADFVDNDDNSKDFRPSGVTSGTANSLELTSKGWRADGGATRPIGLNQDVEIGDLVQLYTASGNTATLIKTTKVSGFVKVVNSGSASTPVFAPNFPVTYTPPTTTFTVATPGGVEFTVDPTEAYDSNEELAVDHRSAPYSYPLANSPNAGATTKYYITLQSGSKGSALEVEIVTYTGLDEPTNSNENVFTLIPGDATSFVTLPSGLKIRANTLSQSAKIVVNEQATFFFGAKHTTYTTSNTAGAGKISLVVLDSNRLNALSGEVTYIVKCSRGGSLKQTLTPLTFTVTSTNSSVDPVNTTFQFSGFTNLVGANTPELGNSGIALNFGALLTNDYAPGFITDDTITVTISPATAGRVKSITLTDPYSATEAIARVRLSKQRTVEIPRLYQGIENWSIQNPEDTNLLKLKLFKNVKIANTAAAAFNVTAGKLYIEYRSVLNLPRVIGSVNTLSDITAQIGTVDPDNPLAYAVYKAWTNANGATVHYIPTISSSLNGFRGFADALELAKGNRNCYSLVPLTTSSEIWNAFIAHVQDESAPDTGRYRILWIAPEVDSHFKVQDAPVGDPTTKLKASTANTELANQPGRWLLTAKSDQDSRFTETVQVGDWVRSNFSIDPTFGTPTFTEYKVVGVVDNSNLIVSSAVAPGLVDFDIEIYRDLASTELASKYVQIAGGFSSERVFAVVPNKGINGLRVDGRPVKNWNVAAAFAGLRSGSRPHQPLSNVELLGFDGLNATIPVFDEVDLDTLRDGGIWVVMNSQDGKIYVERQLSTSTLDNFRKEQSVTCNIDSISFSIGDGLRNLVGRININDNNLSLVRSNLVEILTSFMNATGSETIGAQLISYTIDSITVPSTANDTVKAKVSVSVPLPMNIIDITIVI